MWVQPLPLPPVPDETARIAHAASTKGHIYLTMRDAFGSIYHDAPFIPLYPSRGQPAYAPWRLALITIFQYIENLSDRQTAEMVRGRIDGKYALSLELTDSGFDASVLSEFRSRLVEGNAEADLFTFMLNRFRAKGWGKAGGTPRTASPHVLAAIRAMTRREWVMATRRAALNSLAIAPPDWVRQNARQEWVHH